MEDLDNFYFLA